MRKPPRAPSPGAPSEQERRQTPLPAAMTLSRCGPCDPLVRVGRTDSIARRRPS
ncbi:hypothetical protein NSU_2664 [Novosphingobium pentaromativorans US6-1]|uniref:Uncharacterized protein n=1 Tax=Novosphingobium pentaromativorans US6-1 TaxID=1088721 RepID=G6EE92_9SPHN|nr:hypothetical protein NSU_2664 [Novosphingobium pentaromativorans US6-1]